MPSVAGAWLRASCRLREPWGMSSRRTLVSGLMCSKGSTPVVSSSDSFSTKPIIRWRSCFIASFSVGLNSKRARLERLSINASLTSMRVLWDKNSYLRGPMEKKREIVMSGIRPTGFLHLGNYFGAVRNYVRMQEDYTCFFMVADWHALTTLADTKELKGHVRRVMAENIACGLDPDKAAFYCQSHVPETAELYLLLNMLAYVGELERTPTFKEKVRLQPDNVNAGLLTYPVLQAADILLHRATLVPVGKDQEQHLEMARNISNRFNGRYGEVFPEPFAF